MKTLVYKFYYKAFTVFLALLVITSCSDDDEFKAPTYTSTPGEALLNLPLNNQECELQI